MKEALVIEGNHVVLCTSQVAEIAYHHDAATDTNENTKQVVLPINKVHQAHERDFAKC